MPPQRCKFGSKVETSFPCTELLRPEVKGQCLRSPPLGLLAPKVLMTAPSAPSGGFKESWVELRGQSTRGGGVQDRAHTRCQAGTRHSHT